MATKLVQGPHSLRNRLLIAAGALAALIAGVLAAERPGSADAAASTGYSVVIISGDGMGPAQRTATQLAKYGYKTQPMDALPEGGLLKTNSILPVTDSAAGVLHYHPRPSPDGKLLLFGSKRNGVRELYVMDLTDRTERKITPLETGHAAMWAHWQPTTKQVAN